MPIFVEYTKALNPGIIKCIGENDDTYDILSEVPESEQDVAALLERKKQKGRGKQKKNRHDQKGDYVSEYIR